MLSSPDAGAALEAVLKDTALGSVPCPAPQRTESCSVMLRGGEVTVAVNHLTERSSRLPVRKRQPEDGGSGPLCRADSPVEAQAAFHATPDVGMIIFFFLFPKTQSSLPKMCRFDLKERWQEEQLLPSLPSSVHLCWCCTK